MMKAIKAVAGLAALALWTSAPGDATAQSLGVRADLGNVQIGVTSGDVRFGKHGVRTHRGRPGHRSLRRREPVLFGSGPVNDFARDARRAAQTKRHRPHRRKHHRDRVKVIVGVPLYGYSYADPYVEEGRAFIERGSVVPQVEHGPEPGVVAAEPPDIRGPRFETARGLRASTRDYAVGQILPPGIPYVVLDWQDYDLPPPPSGEIYVRFDGSVLRIADIERRVTEIVWPAGG